MYQSPQSSALFAGVVLLALLLSEVSPLRILPQRHLGSMLKTRSSGLLFASSTIMDPDVTGGNDADFSSPESLITAEPVMSDVDSSTQSQRASKKNYSFCSRLPRQVQTEELPCPANSEYPTNNILSSANAIDMLASEIPPEKLDRSAGSQKAGSSFGTRLRRRAELQRASASEVLKQTLGCLADSFLRFNIVIGPEISRTNYFFGTRSRRAASSVPVVEEEKNAQSFETEDVTLRKENVEKEAAAASTEDIDSIDENTRFSIATSSSPPPAVITGYGATDVDGYSGLESLPVETGSISTSTNFEIETYSGSDAVLRIETEPVKVNYSYGARLKPAVPSEPMLDKSNAESEAPKLSASGSHPSFPSEDDECNRATMNFFEQKQEIVSFAEDDQFADILVEGNGALTNTDTSDASVVISEPEGDEGNYGSEYAGLKEIGNVEEEIRATTDAGFSPEPESLFSSTPIDSVARPTEAYMINESSGITENNTDVGDEVEDSGIGLLERMQEEIKADLVHDQPLWSDAPTSLVNSFDVAASEETDPHKNLVPSDSDPAQVQLPVEDMIHEDEILGSFKGDTDNADAFQIDPKSDVNAQPESSLLNAMEFNNSFDDDVEQQQNSKSLALSNARHLDSTLNAEIARSALWYASMALRR